MAVNLFPLVDGPKLAGIARLAASGRCLESKRRVRYFDLPTRRLLNRCSSTRMPFEWTINPYRGCEFGCKYCYARYTHEFMELPDPRDFEERIYAKQWDAASFRRELARAPLNQSIAIGTATDPYQPAERRYWLTRRVLEVLAAERGRTLSIATKSDLITRDLDLLASITRANVLHVVVTITTLDERLARLLEPLAPRPELRLSAIRALCDTGIQTGVLCCPVMPALNDSLNSLDRLGKAAARAGAVYFGGFPVFLKPSAWQVFYPFLEEHFPELAEPYRQRFSNGAFLRGPYVDEIKRKFQAVRARHRLGSSFPAYTPEQWCQEPQLALPF